MITAVNDPSQVAEARRLVSTYARRAGVTEARIGDVAIVVTELATNLLKHVGSGQILATHRDDVDSAGLELLALDRGRGMADARTATPPPAARATAWARSRGWRMMCGSSTFSVTLPRSYPNAVDQADDADESWTLEPGRVPVLAVDDDPADTFTLRRILADTPYQPLFARSVRQAQQILQHAQPAAILLDVILMGDESWRLLLQLRQQEAYADIPLIVMSSSGEERKAIHLGADEYIAKPVDGMTLIGLLDRLTGRTSITRILLVDDEEVMRYLVRQLLPRSRYSLCAVSTGEEGLQCLQEQHPDVVLLDINMPEMNGHQFLARLRDDATVANVPVIILTSAILAPDERLLLHRASGIMSKSDMSSNTLIETIDRVLPRAPSIWTR